MMLQLQAEVGLDSVGATALSDWLWAAPRIGLKIGNSAHRALIIELLHRLVEMRGELTPRQVTTSLGGLARMRFKWAQLPEQTRTDIITALDSLATDFNDREIGNCLHSLSKLQIPWGGLPLSVRASLLEVFVRESASLVSQQGSMALYSLGMMGLDINCASVSQSVRDHIYLVAVAVVQESTHNRRHTVAQQVTNVVYGLAKMRANWKDMPHDARDGVTEAVCHLNSSLNEQEVANLVYSLGLMGCRWDGLPADARSALSGMVASRLRGMITQGLSCTMYGLALMDAQWGQVGHWPRHTAFTPRP